MAKITITTDDAQLIREAVAQAAVRSEFDLTACDDLLDAQESTSFVVVGWYADDGNQTVYYAHADSGSEAAQSYIDGGSWGEDNETTWVSVRVWRVAYALDEDGDLIEERVCEESHTIAIEPDEPECSEVDGHDWQRPHGLLGGIEENPGVWGSGGGVVITEVCAHCGCYKVTDTWAQCRETGEQGLTSVEYRDADDASLGWIASSRDDDE